jgi:AcrR family transcriptional regulator
MSETAESPRRAPGRPRSEASHQAIIRATLELLLETGYRSLTMDGVRARAGVGKATIYRRWSSKEELVRDAIVFMHDDVEAPDTGSLRGDYEGMAMRVVSAAHRSGAATLMPRLLGDVADDPELRAIFYENLVEPRRAQMRAILNRAMARGEIRDDVDVELIIDLFAGPVIYRLLITGGDYAQLYSIDEQLDVLIGGLAPRRD